MQGLLTVVMTAEGPLAHPVVIVANVWRGVVMKANWMGRVNRCLAVLAMVAGLSACGGGLDDLGPPPEVSLGVSTTLTYRGAAIQLRASAYASNEMEHVRFYRLDYGVPPVLLGYVWAPPANLMTSIPINAGPTVSYFARACDMEGLCSDSNVVTVSVYP